MDTSSTLLESLQKANGTDAWQYLDRIYRPLMTKWLRQTPAPVNDHEDIIQEVLLTVSEKIGDFQKSDRTGAFRAWLKQILIYSLRNFVRKRGNRIESPGNDVFEDLARSLEDPHAELSIAWRQEHDDFVLKYLLEQVREKFEKKTFSAFVLSTVEGKPTGEIADQLNMKPGAIHTAKSRVLAELRRLGQGMLSEDL